MILSFHPLALEQQEEIWYYTYTTWGVEQADRYIHQLHDFLSNLPGDLDAPTIKRVVADLRRDVLMVRYAHHYVFFQRADDQASGNGIQVLSILHESMDLPERLREVLDQIRLSES